MVPDLMDLNSLVGESDINIAKCEESAAGKYRAASPCVHRGMQGKVSLAEVSVKAFSNCR